MIENQHVYCPECDTRIRFYKRPKLGAIVTCPECDEILEVVCFGRLSLNGAPKNITTTIRHPLTSQIGTIATGIDVVFTMR